MAGERRLDEIRAGTGQPMGAQRVAVTVEPGLDMADRLGGQEAVGRQRHEQRIELGRGFGIQLAAAGGEGDGVDADLGDSPVLEDQGRRLAEQVVDGESGPGQRRAGEEGGEADDATIA
ncbi:MAG: hypothetical protein R3D28_12890 [Geminicoccaceae bacterium]